MLDMLKLLKLPPKLRSLRCLSRGMVFEIMESDIMMMFSRDDGWDASTQDGGRPPNPGRAQQMLCQVCQLVDG